MNYAFSFLKKNNNVLQRDFAYTSGTTGENGNCDNAAAKAPNTQLKNYFDVKEDNDYENLIAAL